MFLHRVKESIEMFTTQRGGAKTVLPEGMQEAIALSKREAIDEAVLATNHFLEQQDGGGARTELIFVNQFDWFKYGAFQFLFDGINPSGGNASLFAQISFDSGTTWITATTYYRYYVEHGVSSGAAPINTQANGTAIRFNNTAIGRYMNGEMVLYYPSDRPATAVYDPSFTWHFVHIAPPPGIDLTKGHIYGTHGYGACTSSQISGSKVLPVNGVKFFFGGTPAIFGKIQMLGVPRA